MQRCRPSPVKPALSLRCPNFQPIEKMPQDQADSRNDWQLLLNGFELQQAMRLLEQDTPLSGPTAEIVQELQRRHAYAGVPVPFAALGSEAGGAPAAWEKPADGRTEATAWFPASVAARFGVRIVHLDADGESHPVRVVHAAAAAPGNAPLARLDQVPAPHLLQPAHALRIPVQVDRAGARPSPHAGILLRRNLAAIVQAELDRVIFQGDVARGEPAGVVRHAIDYGIGVSVPIAAASWALFRREITELLNASEACGPDAVSVLLRPEVWAYMDALPKNTSAVTTDWDQLVRRVRRVIPSSVALEPPVSHESKVMLTAGRPIFCGLWGAMDVTPGIAGATRTADTLPVTVRITCDVALDRASQVRVLFKIKSA